MKSRRKLGNDDRDARMALSVLSFKKASRRLLRGHIDISSTRRAIREDWMKANFSSVLSRSSFLSTSLVQNGWKMMRWKAKGCTSSRIARQVKESLEALYGEI